MSIVAGMDLGYGSQVKVVTSNYLVINAAANATDKGAVNFMQLVNQTLTNRSDTDLRQKGFQFDYIMCDGVAPSSITSPSVIDATGTTTVPITGPSPSVLGAQGDLAAHQNSAADIGASANGIILAILSASGGTMAAKEDSSDEIFDTFTAVNMAGLTDDASVLSHLQAELLKAQIEGTSLATLDVTDVLAEIAGETLSSIDVSVAALNADFVAAGNAAGTTATTINSVTANNDKVGIMSITALVRTAQ